jgi:hypothetical protein
MTFQVGYWKTITEDSEDHNSSSRCVDDDDDDDEGFVLCFVFFGNFFCNFVKYVDWRSSMQIRGMSQIWLRSRNYFALALLCLDSLECVYQYFRLKDFGP